MKTKYVNAVSLTGSLATAFLSSICCIGPVVFATLGVSSVAFIQKFEVYRPLFAIVAMISLGTSFYFTYRKKPTQDCKPDSYCAHPWSDRMNKIVLWVATGFVVFFLLYPILFAGGRCIL